MDDLLLLSALAYQNLLPIKYRFLLGRKMKSMVIEISFPEHAYHHLAGFQYSGIEALKNQKTALQLILSKQVTQEHLAAANYQYFDRLAGICQLEKLIEENNFVFYYRGHEKPGSHIRADYVLVNPGTFFFVRNSEPVSIFNNCGQVYHGQCPRFTILKTWRQDILTQDEILIYQSPFFKDTMNEQS